MKKHFIILFVFWCALSDTMAQKENYARFGIGYLVAEKGLQAYAINFPNAAFDLFSAPGSKKVGTIYKKDFINLMYQVNTGTSAFRVKNEDLAEFPGKSFCLKYFEQEDGFLKILVNSTGKGYWIMEKELKYLRINSQSWFEYFVKQKGDYFPVIDIGLNLREKPKAESKKIALLKGDCFMIRLTGTIEGFWAEAEVKKYAARPCKSADLSSLSPDVVMNGWIKILDDSGVPNIWFHVNGCD
ncbi:MAG TPA: hypothetical protein PKI01_06395 [Bacteroidales bacterium]|nr:hypothetical protein [Bacteroidales bacterium]